MDDLKRLINEAVDRLGDELDALSRRIHDHPELGFKEVQAAGWLTEFLSAKGLKVERGSAGMDTSFVGTIETGKGPTIAIMWSTTPCPASATHAGLMMPPRRGRGRALAV
jgi:metal-dependent amidase/aminoacylase/carboxypeptidase family protein